MNTALAQALTVAYIASARCSRQEDYARDDEQFLHRGETPSPAPTPLRRRLLRRLPQQ
jgi:hypothetical protein